jgi:hypothetical protein
MLREWQKSQAFDMRLIFRGRVDSGKLPLLVCVGAGSWDLLPDPDLGECSIL